MRLSIIWQVLAQQVFSDISLPVLSWPVTQTKRASNSLHSWNSGIEKVDAFSTSTLYLFIFFFIKAMLEIKNPGCSFLLCLFFFDSLSCLVSPILFIYFLIFYLLAVRMTDREREMLDFFSLVRWESNWRTVVRPRVHWVIRAISFRNLGGGVKQNKIKPSHNQADEPVRSGTSRNTTKNSKGEDSLTLKSPVDSTPILSYWISKVTILSSTSLYKWPKTTGGWESSILRNQIQMQKTPTNHLHQFDNTFSGNTLQ